MSKEFSSINLFLIIFTFLSKELKMTKKNFLLVFIALGLLYIAISLSPLLTKDAKDISYSDFKLVIGPFLSTIAILITYTQLKRRKN